MKSKEQRAGKPRASKLIAECAEIAGRLKRSDIENYGEIFKWMYRAPRCGVEWPVILEALKIMERHDGYGQKPRELYQYMNAILRSLRQQKEAKSVRSGATSIGEMLAPLVDAVIGEEDMDVSTLKIVNEQWLSEAADKLAEEGMAATVVIGEDETQVALNVRSSADLEHIRRVLLDVLQTLDFALWNSDTAEKPKIYS